MKKYILDISVKSLEMNELGVCVESNTHFIRTTEISKEDVTRIATFLVEDLKIK